MQDYFQSLSSRIEGFLQGSEVFTCGFRAEDSDFVRFNHARVRQAGSVHQARLGIDLIDGRRHAAGSLSLAGSLDEDVTRVGELMTGLREQLRALPEDPHLLYSTEVHSTEKSAEDRLPEPDEVLGAVESSSGERDLVGIYAAGGIHCGFANSLGQRNWSSTHAFNLDCSLHHEGDKAVKTGLAGFEFDASQLERKMELAKQQLSALARPPRTISPGHHRVYLAPAALGDVIEIISYDAFGLHALRTRTTPLLRLYDRMESLAPFLGIVENTAEGLAPNFQDAGFIRPERVPLVEEGKAVASLVSPRSEQEHGVSTNGASASESPESLEVSAGTLATDDVLAELGTGAWVGNVWYLNYSDRSHCRTTGMTRFATFWVEDGKIVAPLNVMRFDETLYRALGENLVGLTSEREWILDPSTYDARSTRSALVPGALVDDFAFTL